MATQKHKILVVDDEPDLEHLMRQRLRRDLRKGRFDLVFASNGVEALTVLKTDPDIDMVLSDINMPKMDGLTLLEHLPEVDPNVRAVIVSAYGDMTNIRTAMNRGAFDFVTKPIDFKDLRITIEKTLEHLHLLHEALAARDRLVALQNELDLASKMQQSILPTTFPDTPDYQVFGNMEPAREVGGDFFDIVPLKHGRLGIAIADVSGKGVPAALFMMSSRTLLKGAAIGCPEPGDALREVNELIAQDNESMMFVTVFYAVYDPADGTLTYANGGHNPPLVVTADGTSTLLPTTDGIALGIVPGAEYPQRTVTLAPGDTVVLYTDGVPEAMNAAHEEFGMSRFREVLASAPTSDAQASNLKIFQAVRAFAGDTAQSDDITCLTLSRRNST